MVESISGKIILITGSTDGLGKLLAQHLANQGGIIVLHGRNQKKGEALVNELSGKTKTDKIKYYNGDYSSLQEVKELSEKIRMDYDHIDILINNVGIGRGSAGNHQREVSQEGIELRFAVNYVAHVLLTEKLLSIIKPGGRIINVASVGQEPINFANLMLERNYDGYFAYKQSKTALIMYTFDLAEELKKRDIKVNAVHPASLMNTNMVLNDWGYSLTTVEQGAEAVENLLFSEITGAYFDGKHLSKAIAQTYDLKARRWLKDRTMELLEKFL